MYKLICLCCLCVSTSFVSAQQLNANLKIEPVSKDVYLYTTYNLYNGSRISANALYVVTDAGVVLIDSPWDSTQFQPLLDTIMARYNKKVVLCIATHFHADRTGGLDYYSRQGIRTYTTKMTDELSTTRGMKRARFLVSKDTVFKVGQYEFQTFYPGPGHAPDNIVIWLKSQELLYGGCLIKSTADKTLGNLGDANVKEYANSVQKVKEKYSSAKLIIPGHNDWHDKESLNHTLKLARDLAK